jgi:signal transduction histidine kinase
MDGSGLSVGITYAPLFDTRGRLINIIANVRDITRFRAAEEAKTTFVSVISHELKTPVSLIKGYASTLRREDARWDEKVVRDGLQVIEEESDRLAELIENLLDATRLQSGKLALQFEPVQLDELAAHLVERFKTQTDKHSFEVSFPKKFPVIQGDSKRLTQVLSNLLNNAIKYSPNGGPIRLSGEVLPDTVRLTVSDQGIGLPQGELELVFERFYQVDNALSRETQGAGLGLYIVRSIIEAHGGQIWAESTPGHGTTFYCTIPISQDR